MSTTQASRTPGVLRSGAAVILGTVLTFGMSAAVPTSHMGKTYAQEVAPEGIPTGWHLAGTRPESYRVGVEDVAPSVGRSSAFLQSKVPETGGFGTLMQSIKAAQYAGERMRLRAELKSGDGSGGAGLWMRVDRGEKVVAFDNMQDRALTANTAWKTYDVVLDVPKDATGISFGVLLSGSGEVRMRGVQFEVVGLETATTGSNASQVRELPVTPVNLELRR